MKKFLRLLRHLFFPPWLVRRTFSARDMQAITAAIRESEATHRGEIRFAVETTLHPWSLLLGQSARQRAVEAFAHLRVWDTEENNGVLIYLLLADRDVEIVADRGIHRRTGDAPWEDICRRMEQDFRQGRFTEGVVVGIRSAGTLLARHYPPRPGDSDELPNQPALL